VLQQIADSLGLKPYNLFFDEEDWGEFDRYTLLARILNELKEIINTDLENVMKKYF